MHKLEIRLFKRKHFDLTTVVIATCISYLEVRWTGHALNISRTSACIDTKVKKESGALASEKI